MNASSIWNLSEADFPADESPRQKLAFAQKYAAMAPTEQDWQPWHFRLEDTYLELMAKHKPELEEADPDGRELVIGCGAALLYLKQALKHFGCLGRVALFPDLGNPALVARIHFGFGRERDSQEKLFFHAMTGSRTNGWPLGERPVSDRVLAALSHAAAGERGWLDFVQSETSRQHLLRITLSDNFHGADAAGSRTRPLFAFGGPKAASWKMSVEPVYQPSAEGATMAVVKTKTDDKHGWLEAGQTMAQTVLQAQALCLSWEFFDPVRRREAREELRLGVGHKGYAQVVLRFGPLMTEESFLADAPAMAAAATYR